MTAFLGILSLVSGLGSFLFANPAGLPVLGLASAAAGILREYHGSKRSRMFMFLTIGLVLCVYQGLFAIGVLSRS